MLPKSPLLLLADVCSHARAAQLGSNNPFPLSSSVYGPILATSLFFFCLQAYAHSLGSKIQGVTNLLFCLLLYTDPF